MIVVLPYCARDYWLAQKLVGWINVLSPNLRPHALVLLAGSTVDWQQQQTLAESSRKTWGSVTIVKQRKADERPWPRAPNSMFRVGTRFVAHQFRQPFLWLEPDAAPLKPTWLDDLNHEYEICGKPFMGTIWDHPRPHMNGNGIYPNGFTYDGPDQVPFDVHLAQRYLGETHNTDLIHHEWGDVEKNKPWTFPDAQSLSRVRSGAVLFHRCKDSSILARLSESCSASCPIAPANGFFADVKRVVRGALRLCSTYYHSGNLGDIIYALYAIKLAGGGDLVVGPEQKGTSPCAVPVSRDQFNLLQPLLEQQDYLRGVSYSPKYPAKRMVDLNTFRNNWNNWDIRHASKADTLCKMHCHTLGVLDYFREDEPWLTVPRNVPTGKVIVHRSSRYHSEDFPWRRLVADHGPNMLFVGLESEHVRFCRDFGQVSFWKARDFLEMAAVIGGGKGFIGNQSFPLSLALGLGQRVIVEEWSASPDCRFRRETYRSQHGLDIEHAPFA